MEKANSTLVTLSAVYEFSFKRFSGANLRTNPVSMEGCITDLLMSYSR